MPHGMGMYEHVVSQGGRLHGRRRSERQLVLLVSLAALCIVIFSVVHAPGKAPAVLRCFQGLSIGVTVAAVLGCVAGYPLTRRMMCAYVVVAACGLLFMDLEYRTLQVVHGVWPAVVLLADFTLILRLDRRFAVAVVASASVWLALVEAEAAFRFGLFDLPGTRSQEFRRARQTDRLACAELPCPVSVGTGLTDLCTSLFVLWFDFLATRGFAEQVAQEQAMSHTIETVEAVATLLASYDVDTVAQRLVEADGQLPAAVHDALQRLEQNLRAYRPYLPAALFEPCSAQSPRHTPAPAPGAVSGEATLVFTDIRASTTLWEMVPEAMKKAIRIHNAVIRAAVAAHGGYEVKTIGDAFMVAFDAVQAGVDFGLTVQEQLLEAEWPAELLEVDLCGRGELWGGLTVRIGVNHGAVSLETNTVTGRADYLGHTVNVAARLEGVCLPGAVAVPADAWASVASHCLPAVAGPPVPVELKGVRDALHMHHVWPVCLADRQQHPLDARIATRDTADTSSGHSQIYSRYTPGVRSIHATVALLSVGCAGCTDEARCVTEGLESVAPLLEQSGGAFVTLCGEYVWAGWNLTGKTLAHGESSLRFTQRVVRAPALQTMTLGLASGTVQQGDVGTNAQRFVTPVGPAVSACMWVWRLSCDLRCRCMYVATQGLPSPALEGMLLPASADHSQPHRTVYQLRSLSRMLDSA